jgi:predicted acylesterase/phospholipase RssA
MVLCSVLLSACASAPPRTVPLPEGLADQATVLGLPKVRTWADALPSKMRQQESAVEQEIRERYSGVIGVEHHYLALSGGGENGAFAAGLLSGWTEAGTRPSFTVVTGISTGALIAPFAFLGSEYDDEITHVYTHYSMDDLVDRRAVVNIIRNDSITDSAPLRAMIERYVTPRVVNEIAAEYRIGRRLLIGTTNLDAARPVMWDIGAIAASGAPGSVELIRDIMLASASIPAGLPPVIIEVEHDGKRYDEMHADGGVTEQVFLYPVSVHWNRMIDKMQLPAPPRVYIIRNGYLQPRWEPMERKLVPIAGRTINSLIRTQGIGDLYRMYITTQRDGLEYHLAYIPLDFADGLEERSGLQYMRKLYDFAFEQARQGYPWELVPPGVDQDEDL